jgi:hypothetical protein
MVGSEAAMDVDLTVPGLIEFALALLVNNLR